jgi:hypothetical protein
MLEPKDLAEGGSGRGSHSPTYEGAGSSRAPRTCGRTQGSPKLVEVGRFGRFPIQPVRPGSEKNGSELVPNRTKKPGQTEESGLPTDLPGFPIILFICKPERVWSGEPWSYQFTLPFRSSSPGTAAPAKMTMGSCLLGINS